MRPDARCNPSQSPLTNPSFHSSLVEVAAAPAVAGRCRLTTSEADVHPSPTAPQP